MRCTQVGRVDGKVCGRPLVGNRHWCWVHPEAEQDYGPYAGEDARDRRDAAKIDREAEIDDEAVQLSFELPFRRPMVVSTFSEGEMATWTAAHR
jgi:hypothetical protein